jgi:S-adenosylmethionine decarboxylase
MQIGFFQRKDAMAEVGKHIIADFWGVKEIEDQEQVKKILEQSAKEAGSTLLDINIYKFDPKGLTGIAVLAESHISIHTWPERQYIAVDAFTCGKHTDPRRAIDCLAREFAPSKTKIIEVKRAKQ